MDKHDPTIWKFMHYSPLFELHEIRSKCLLPTLVCKKTRHSREMSRIFSKVLENQPSRLDYMTWPDLNFSFISLKTWKVSIPCLPHHPLNFVLKITVPKCHKVNNSHPKRIKKNLRSCSNIETLNLMFSQELKLWRKLYKLWNAIDWLHW